MFKQMPHMGKGLKIMLMVTFMASAFWMSPDKEARATGLFSQNAFKEDERRLSFYNTHTRETLEVSYFTKGKYDRTAIASINDILRDHRSGHSHEVDHELLDLLYDIKQELNRRYPEKEIRFDIISGYRSPVTNSALRANGGGQAKKSRHMRGDAIDIRVKGIKTSELRDIAFCMQRGGVGYYSGSDFLHIDTHKKTKADKRFENGQRMRAWGFTPNPSVCTPSSS